MTVTSHFKEKEKDSNCMPFCKRQNSGDNKNMSGCQEFAERSIQSTDILMNSESTLSDITVMDICGHTFVQTHRICNTALLIKVNPKVNWECFDCVSV